MKYFVFLLGIALLGEVSAMNLKSSAFGHHGKIPKLYTCVGENKSPPLSWEGVPKATKTFVLICDDPDAPRGPWDHWVLYNIPSSIREIKEGSSAGETGLNSWNNQGYGGPCPPSGEHRYIFKLYALDKALTFEKIPTKKDLEEAIEGHILAESELLGLFKKT